MNSAPDANRYAAMLGASRVREKALFPAERVPSELELQARWFAGDFGTKFRSTGDEEVEVVQFGTWNREAGPDFSDAAIRINGTETIGGSIEFDVTDRNWELHKHAVNPAFDETILHVFLYQGPRRFFTRTSSNRNVLQVRVDLADLPQKFSANVPLARPGRCQAPLKNLPEEACLQRARFGGAISSAAQSRSPAPDDRMPRS